VQYLPEDTVRSETLDTYESPALFDLGTLEELTLALGVGGSESGILGLAPVSP